MSAASITAPTAHPTREAYLHDVTRMQQAALAYYTSDADVMDDATYDQLVAALAASEAQHPEWVNPAASTGVVAGGAIQVDAALALTHIHPMLSLDNVFTTHDLASWLEGRTKLAGRTIRGFVVEPKFDGLAIAARYEHGTLITLATRGDGTVGENVTYALGRIPGLPTQLPTPFTGEIRGEVLFRTDDFHTANAARIATGANAYANARNAAAGALRAEELPYPVQLTFFAYALVGDTPASSHSQELDLLDSWGFANPGIGRTRCTSISHVQDVISEIADARAHLPFCIDGAVIKVDDLGEQGTLGLASRAPRWAIAYKYPAESRHGLLASIEVQVGRTGVITPVAVLDPAVTVGGTSISRVTLHNFDDLTRRNVRVGDTVEVRRAGDVIPEIVGAHLDKRPADSVAFVPPTDCPRCGGPIDRSQVRWRCTRGRTCGLSESIRYAVARDAWDMEGLGEKIVTTLVADGVLTDVADVFGLTEAQLLAVPRLGQSNTDKILAQIHAARQAPLARTITALGIRMTGRSMSRRLARHFPTMTALQEASIDQLCRVEAVGVERAATIREELDELAPVIDKLVAFGVSMTDGGSQDSTPSSAGSSLANHVIVISGAVPGFTRNQAHERIEQLGGQTSSSVSKNTTMLVSAETTTSKVMKARELGVSVVDPDTFVELLAGA